MKETLSQERERERACESERCFTKFFSCLCEQNIKPFLFVNSPLPLTPILQLSIFLTWKAQHLKNTSRASSSIACNCSPNFSSLFRPCCCCCCCCCCCRTTTTTTHRPS
jgi:hypothetical protein